MTELLIRLLDHLSARRRLQLGLLFLLVLLASVTEAISIGAVIPFLAILAAPRSVFGHPSVQPVIQFLEIEAAEQLVLPLTLAFGCAALTAGAVRLLFLWVSTRWSYGAAADLSINIYRRTLYQPYPVHAARNSSEIISGIFGKVNSVSLKLLQVINLIGATFILAGILSMLLLINPGVAIATTIGFTVIYAAIMTVIRGRLNANSIKIARESDQVIKSLQEGLGGIRDILLDGSQAVYCRHYQIADLNLRHAQGSNSFMSSSPRYLVESVSMLLIAYLAYFLAQSGEGIGEAVPVLGALALGAQRMLPAMQMGYAAWVSLRGDLTSISDTIELLDQTLPEYADHPPPTPLSLKDRIEVQNLSFRYSQDGAWILRNINLQIKKGSRVGFIGATGTGKSTFLDIVMGLLTPTEGKLVVDGAAITPESLRRWQAGIAHVPQSIFLSDGSIEQNIAFGIDNSLIDHERVRLAAKQAQLHDYIESCPDGYATFVGERGIRLSGGQRQRIGIARALYKRAHLIIFDEATSALDFQTEKAVIASIEALNPDLTILMVAHRLSTLSKCSQIIELVKGEIYDAGSFDECMRRQAYSQRAQPNIQ